MCWQSKRLNWKGVPRAESSGVRATRRTALPRDSQSQVLWWWGEFLINHLTWPIFGLTQGPSWWCMRLSAKMDSSVKDSGRLVGRIVGWHLLPFFGPSWILPVSFQWQHHVLYPDLMLWDNSCKRLSSRLAKVGSFGQQFPNALAFVSMSFVSFLFHVNLDSKFHHFTALQEWKYPLTPRF